jgi:histidine triad (HIT) family protein
MFMKTVFEKILEGELPCHKVYENQFVFAFHDLNPQAPIHILVVPKTRMRNVNDASEDLVLVLGHLLLGAKKVAEKLGIARSGYRLVINNGEDGFQEIPYLHCHVLGGRKLTWPPG